MVSPTVTRLGDIGQFYLSLWQILRVHLVFRKMLNLLWEIFNAFLQISIVMNGQILKTFSSYLVTLMVAPYLLSTYTLDLGTSFLLQNYTFTRVPADVTRYACFKRSDWLKKVANHIAEWHLIKYVTNLLWIDPLVNFHKSKCQIYNFVQKVLWNMFCEKNIWNKNVQLLSKWGHTVFSIGHSNRNFVLNGFQRWRENQVWMLQNILRESRFTLSKAISLQDYINS